MTSIDKFVQKTNEILLKSDDSEISNALEYLVFRGIKEETIKIHNIGYCPSDFNIEDEIRYFGLTENKDRDLSYFILGKIIVPVYDEFGISVGFATRKPTFKKGEKWWNLPIPFYKGKHLFLLNKTKKQIYNSNKIYLVEGYIDALYLYQEGIKNVSGIMGTALTLRKIGLIARYCNNICLCFDIDENMAGQNAMDKSICQLHKLNFCENIMILKDFPQGKDPDEYVKDNGINKFLEHEYKLSIDDIKVSYSNIIKIIEERKDNDIKR